MAELSAAVIVHRDIAKTILQVECRLWSGSTELLGSAGAKPQLLKAELTAAIMRKMRL
jgi:hypothetical protein